MYFFSLFLDINAIASFLIGIHIISNEGLQSPHSLKFRYHPTFLVVYIFKYDCNCEFFFNSKFTDRHTLLWKILLGRRSMRQNLLILSSIRYSIMWGTFINLMINNRFLCTSCVLVISSTEPAVCLTSHPVIVMGNDSHTSGNAAAHIRDYATLITAAQIGRYTHTPGIQNGIMVTSDISRHIMLKYIPFFM